MLYYSSIIHAGGLMKGRYFVTKKKQDPIKEYKLKNGKVQYKFNIYLGVDEVTGKEKRVGRQGFDTKKEARIEISRLKLQFEESQTIYDERTKKVKFEYVYDLWFEQYRNTVKESTYAIEKQRADNHVLPKFKGMFIDKINLRHCQKTVNNWFDYYQKANLLISVFNRIMKFAKTMRYCEDNPMNDVIKPNLPDSEEYESPFYERDQLITFLNEVDKTGDLQQIAAFRLLAYTGIRKGELHGLRWKDIDLQSGLLSIRRVLARGVKDGYSFQSPKTKSSIRDISLDDETMNILKRYRSYQRETMLKLGYNTNSPEQLVFTNIENQFLKLDYFNRKLTKIIEKNNFPHMTMHGFRHTHCSLLFDAGLPIKEVQDRLGHSSADTTMNIYNHVMNKKKKETGNKFAAYMNF